MKSTNFVLSVAVAAAFWGCNARAPVQANELERGAPNARYQMPAPPSEKTAEDIINEARARLEGSRASSNGKEQRKWEPPKFYVGFATERIELNIGSIAEPVQAAQREASPLRYLTPVSNFSEPPFQSDALLVGARLKRWLSVELSYRSKGELAFCSAIAPVFDPTVLDGRRVFGGQWTTLGYGAWELSVLPRWHLGNKGWKELLALYGRVGIGYARSSMSTIFESHVQELRPLPCDAWYAANGICPNGRHYDTVQTNSWGALDEKDRGLFPVFGVGIELSPFFHVEYQLRAAVPIAGRTTTMQALTLQLSL